ncbi:unnamed protein product [Cryptosporidium hominis]|uniref:D-glutamate cyclase-like C-terminal domain-containing protein n=1 Tax=Cryptosporidium hominis TaxID=237895 RepID=A0A0S4TF40_CRYHO|nr:hypothetical protein [Cryptosporidium hominis TU502]OLQ15742.1 protein of unknown function (DUF4392) [Cryptosporidium hominis]PPA64363.1 hypothetical protein ChUKH1_04315 [Cryptosporidium hominis]PPS92652.1 hypothetical protein GY17_00003345 [Cryptosporidium hominis]CUV05543.1 unnamed protein product [Cryptosporidium hominis]|eukprot:PPS92652.1 hypothetical protein GY17_00003345 [Cryptosporidium hominis]
MTENNINIANIQIVENKEISKLEEVKPLPSYYGDMSQVLTLEEALKQYDQLKLKNTISPRKSIKEYADKLKLSSIAEVSKLLYEISLNNDSDTNNVIGIFALSPNNVSHLPPTEKDGLSGLAVLSNALSNLGFTVVIMTDSINQPVISSILSNNELFKHYVDINQEVGYAPKDLNLEKRKTYVIGVVPDPGIDSEWEEFLDNIQKKFSLLMVLGRPSRELDTGIYRNSRGLRINHYCSNLEGIYIKIMQQENKIPIFAFSDSSENQLGVYQKDDNRSQYNANYIIISHTVDWVCYYLSAGIALRFISNIKNLYADNNNKENNQTVDEINAKMLRDAFQSFFPSEDTFIYLNEKITELEVWDTQYGDNIKKGFTIENDWETRMKIRRIVSQFGVSIEFEHV